MAYAVDNATPPPAHDQLSPPPAPRFGTFLDNWGHTHRKSARISSRPSASARTPSPNVTNRRTPPPPTLKKASHKQSASFIASPDASPRKKRRTAPDFVRRASGETFTDSAATASQSSMAKGRKPRDTTATMNAMLPTPSKTPQKPPTQASAAKITSFAKTLFPPDLDGQVLSPSAKRAKQYSGMTMESFTAEDVEDPIEIFTDTQDRVPERDEDPSNPFFGDNDGAATAPHKRRSKRHTVTIPGEGRVSIDEAAKRTDGMVFVFRGKRIWRPSHPHSDDDAEHNRVSRATSTPVRGKLLFPKKQPDIDVDNEDEEATTDLEDNEPPIESASPPQTPTKPIRHTAKTPQTPRFAPVSPPSTRRVTRSTNRLDDEDTPLRGLGSLKRSSDAVDSQAKRQRA